MGDTTITFKAPRTVAAFGRSNAFGRVLTGPVGSGKTTGCVIELLRRANEQAPAPDGKRYTRFAVVRQTLKQLKDTVLKDCQNWLTGLGDWKVSENTFHLRYNDIISEWVFIPLEDAEDQGRLLSMQLTGAWMSEVIEMDISILGPLSGRIGRYPSGRHGVPSWAGIIADTNMPTELTPWHNFMENLPNNWQKFVQPSGLAPDAENLDHLWQTAETKQLPLGHPERIAQGRKYYQNLVDMYGIDSDWVRRYVKAEYGDDPSGLAVFKESWKTSFHAVEDTLVIPGYPLLISQDFGRNPWSLIGQVDHMGRVLIHEEVPATNIGLEKHVNEHLRPRLFSERFLGHQMAVVGDPAGVAKGTISEESNFDALKRLGFSCFPAPTNDIDPRLRAVEAFLTRQQNGGPALMVSRKGCPYLVRALAGAYRYTRNKASGSLKPVPDKGDVGAGPDRWNPSHVADCLQYFCLVAHGGMTKDIFARLRRRPHVTGPRITQGGWT